MVELADRAVAAMKRGRYRQGFEEATEVLRLTRQGLAPEGAAIAIEHIERLIQATVGAGEAMLDRELFALTAPPGSTPPPYALRGDLMALAADLHRALEPAYDALLARTEQVRP